MFAPSNERQHLSAGVSYLMGDVQKIFEKPDTSYGKRYCFTPQPKRYYRNERKHKLAQSSAVQTNRFTEESENNVSCLMECQVGVV